MAIDEWEEKRSTERDESTELNRRLAAAGEEIRAIAKGREVGSRETDSWKRQSTPGSRRQNLKRAIFADSDEEKREFINAHATAGRELEELRLKMEEERLSFESERVERLDCRMQRTQDH